MGTIVPWHCWRRADTCSSVAHHSHNLGFSGAALRRRRHCRRSQPADVAPTPPADLGSLGRRSGRQAQLRCAGRRRALGCVRHSQLRAFSRAHAVGPNSHPSGQQLSGSRSSDGIFGCSGGRLELQPRPESAEEVESYRRLQALRSAGHGRASSSDSQLHCSQTQRTIHRRMSRARRPGHLLAWMRRALMATSWGDPPSPSAGCMSQWIAGAPGRRSQPPSDQHLATM